VYKSPGEGKGSHWIRPDQSVSGLSGGENENAARWKGGRGNKGKEERDRGKRGIPGEKKRKPSPEMANALCEKREGLEPD